MEQKFNEKHIIIIGLIILAITAVALFISLGQANTINVTIAALPDDAQLFINEEKINSGSQKLTPGTYTFTGSKDGFERDSYSVKITSDSDVRLILTPVSEDAKKSFEGEEIQALKEEYGGMKAALIGDSARSQNDIINKLPVDEFTYKGRKGPFSIDYGFSNADKTAIFILISNSSPNGRRNATNWISDSGYSVADMDIRFEDFKNPLENTGGAL